MACAAKYSGVQTISNILRHNDRLPENYKNNDIDRSRSCFNYRLSPERGMSSFSYYKKCLSEMYVYQRSNVVTLCEWVVTAPPYLSERETENFYSLTYDFLVKRYYKGSVYCIQAVVHMDETAANGHMHFTWIPAVPDPRHGGDKVCCKDVITRQELRDFHPSFQKYLNENGLSRARIMTGVTAGQGGNRTVREMKKQREEEREIHPVRTRRFDYDDIWERS